MDDLIRRIQALLPAIIVSGLALYFAVVFLVGGGKTLLLMYQGGTDYVATALAQALGYAFGPWFAKVGMVAGATGAIQLAVGGFFILSVTERSFVSVERKDYGALDFALHGAVALMMFQAIPAWIGGDESAIRSLTAHGMLICVIIGTSMFERETTARQFGYADQYDTAVEYRPFH